MCEFGLPCEDCEPERDRAYTHGFLQGIMAMWALLIIVAVIADVVK